MHDMLIFGLAAAVVVVRVVHALASCGSLPRRYATPVHMALYFVGGDFSTEPIYNMKGKHLLFSVRARSSVLCVVR